MSEKISSPGKKPDEVREYHSPYHGLFFSLKKVLHSQQSAWQKIDVVENEYLGRILFLDGLVQTCEKDEFFYHEMLVHPALVSHPCPENILLVGGGDGGALKEIVRYPEVKKVYFVEIDSQVIDVSLKFFPWLRHCLKDERVELVVADGNEFILETDEKFDVVLVDSSEPVGPSKVLHHADFFRNLRGCLREPGVVVTQSGSPLYHLENLRHSRRALKEVFKIVKIYLSPVPTYPGGSWSFLFLSQSVDPFSLRRDEPSELKFYSKEIHTASFVLPQFIKQRL